MAKYNKQIGFIGLGRMGKSMVELLAQKGYEVFCTDVSVEARKAMVATGVKVYDDVPALVKALPSTKVLWLMVPGKNVDSVLRELTPLLSAGDLVIDGGNSFYRDSVRRHGKLEKKQIDFLDCGTSGGVDGARSGSALMVGGDMEVWKKAKPIFTALAKRGGCARVGGAGAGHFVKAVHNAIEYGMMGAIAEGMALVEKESDTFDLSMEGVLATYENGSIIESRLMSWTGQAYRQGLLESVVGKVPVGETEKKMQHLTTLDEMLVLNTALQQRANTRKKPSRVGAYIAGMRNMFGGHHFISKKVSKKSTK